MHIIIEVVTANTELVAATKNLFKAYQQELNENLCFQGFEEELENPLKKYAAPSGVILLAKRETDYIGCIALQPLLGNNCEMKRLYVTPNYRKFKVGQLLVEQILLEAKKRNYTTMKLDTLSRLVPAIKLYEKYGFENVNAYYENPLPNVVYMEKQLV
jgi:GNAT superfamily N-acetyltransferase